MNVYHFNAETGAYLGSSQADESPLEPGVFLIPAHSTTEIPPGYEEGEIPVWDGSEWSLQPVAPVIPPPVQPDPATGARWNDFYQAILGSQSFAAINTAARTDANLAVAYADVGFALTRASLGLVNTVAIQSGLDNLLNSLVGDLALTEELKAELQSIVSACNLSEQIALNFPQ